VNTTIARHTDSRLGRRDVAGTRRLVSLFVLSAAISAFLVSCGLLFSLTVDDAYISFRYSDNLVSGHGLVWNAGETPVEGYTNFLWVIIGAGVLKIGLPIVASMKVVGVVVGLIAVLLMYIITRKISAPDTYAVMPALLLAVTPAFALWSVAGLETALFVALLLASLYFFVSEESATHVRRSAYFSAPLMLLLALTRPEGIAVFGLLASTRVLLWVRDPHRRRDVVRYIIWALAFGLLWLLYFVWRWSYFGYPFPNTAYVKVQSGLTTVAGQIGVYLIPYALRLIPFVLLAIYALGQKERIERVDVYILTALGGLFVLNLISSDWMPGHRLALPMTPLVFLLARDPLETAFRSVWEGRWRQRLSAAAIVLALVAFAMAPMLYTANLFHRVMATQMDMSIFRWAREMQSIVDGQYVEVGNWLADNAPEGASVVAPNVGAIGYLSGLAVIDTIGLTDAAIARNGWTVDYLLASKPEFIVIESDTPERFGGLYGTSGELFAATPEFVEDYEQVFVLDNGRADELALFLHHLPHATWLYARRELGLGGAEFQVKK